MRLLKQGKNNVDDLTKPYKLKCPECGAIFLVDCIDDVKLSKQKIIEKASFNGDLFDCNIACLTYVECPWCNDKLYIYDLFDHYELFRSKWHKLMIDIYNAIKGIIVYQNDISKYFGDETSKTIPEFKNIYSELEVDDV